MLDVEKSLIKQIVAVIGKDYLKEILNEGTETIIVSITQLLVRLVTYYGMMDLYVLYREEAKVEALFCNLSDPPVQIYNTIEDLFDIVEVANICKSLAKVINFGLDIICKSSGCELALTYWFNLPIAEHF